MVLKSIEKAFTNPFMAVFFTILSEKSFKIYLKHNGYGLVSESFALK